MNQLMAAAYVAIVLHFLRKTRRKLFPESRMRLTSIAATTVTPVHVAIPRTDLALDPVPIATCLNWEVARMLVHELQCRGIPSTISVPDETDPLTPFELGMLSTCVVSRDLIAIAYIANGRYSDLRMDTQPDFTSKVADATMTTRAAVMSTHNVPTPPSQKGAGR